MNDRPILRRNSTTSWFPFQQPILHFQMNENGPINQKNVIVPMQAQESKAKFNYNLLANEANRNKNSWEQMPNECSLIQNNNNNKTAISSLNIDSEQSTPDRVIFANFDANLTKGYSHGNAPHWVFDEFLIYSEFFRMNFNLFHWVHIYCDKGRGNAENWWMNSQFLDNPLNIR